MYGEPLPDRRAQRCSDDVCGRDAVAVQNGHRVAGQVRQRVRMPGEVDAVGTTGVTVIEPDHLSAAAHEGLHEFVRPADGRGGGTHDQQNSGVSRVAETLGPQLDLPRMNELFLSGKHAGHRSGYQDSQKPLPTVVEIDAHEIMDWWQPQTGRPTGRVR